MAFVDCWRGNLPNRCDSRLGYLGRYLVTCAKAIVTAVLHTKDGRQYTGRNDCDHPVTDCPRVVGEGYAKCKYICRQPCHAEIDAMRQAFINKSPLKGGMMIVSHHRVCGDCQIAMTEAGISWSVTHAKKQRDSDVS